MTNVNYVKGRAFENYVANYLRRNGFYVVRSAGSKRIFDLVAIYRGNVYGIQCKTNGRLLRKEITEMLRNYVEHAIEPIFAFRQNRRVILQNLRTGGRFTLKQFVESVKSERLCTTC